MRVCADRLVYRNILKLKSWSHHDDNPAFTICAILLFDDPWFLQWLQLCYRVTTFRISSINQWWWIWEYAYVTLVSFGWEFPVLMNFIKMWCSFTSLIFPYIMKTSYFFRFLFYLCISMFMYLEISQYDYNFFLICFIFTSGIVLGICQGPLYSPLS